MKKFLLSVVFSAFVAGIAISSSPLSAFAADEKKPPAEKTKKDAAAKPRSITGKIKAVDAKAGTVTISKKKAKEKTATDFVITVTGKTKFKEISGLADLKTGDKIQAKYVEKDGKMIAKSVEKKLPGEKKAKKKKKEHKEDDDGE